MPRQFRFGRAAGSGLGGTRRRQDGVHRRVLCRKERADHGGHGLHGEGAGGEAAEVLPGGAGPLPAGQTQGWPVHAAEGQ